METAVRVHLKKGVISFLIHVPGLRRIKSGDFFEQKILSEFVICRGFGFLACGKRLPIFERGPVVRGRLQEMLVFPILYSVCKKSRRRLQGFVSQSQAFLWPGIQGPEGASTLCKLVDASIFALSLRAAATD